MESVLSRFAGAFDPPRAEDHDKAGELVRTIQSAGGLRHRKLGLEARRELSELLRRASAAAALSQDARLEREILSLALECGPMPPEDRDRLAHLLALQGRTEPAAQCLYAEFLLRNAGRPDLRTRDVREAWSRIAHPDPSAAAMVKRSAL
jgi:hypothetical protein